MSGVDKGWNYELRTLQRKHKICGDVQPMTYFILLVVAKKRRAEVLLGDVSIDCGCCQGLWPTYSIQVRIQHSSPCAQALLKNHNFSLSSLFFRLTRVAS